MDVMLSMHSILLSLNTKRLSTTTEVILEKFKHT